VAPHARATGVVSGSGIIESGGEAVTTTWAIGFPHARNGPRTDGQGFGLPSMVSTFSGRGVCWTPLDLAGLDGVSSVTATLSNGLKRAGVNMVRSAAP
jgi:hypothetical protein